MQRKRKDDVDPFRIEGKAQDDVDPFRREGEQEGWMEGRWDISKMHRSMDPYASSYGFRSARNSYMKNAPAMVICCRFTKKRLHKNLRAMVIC